MSQIEPTECPAFDLVCPRCAGHCIGKTRTSGGRGTYREVYVKFGVERISCSACGYIKDLDPYAPQELKLWYRFEIGSHSVWAHNRNRFVLLKEFLEGGVDPNEEGFDALPKWMLEKRNRASIIAEISRMLARATDRGEQGVDPNA